MRTASGLIAHSSALMRLGASIRDGASGRSHRVQSGSLLLASNIWKRASRSLRLMAFATSGDVTAHIAIFKAYAYIFAVSSSLVSRLPSCTRRERSL